MDATQNQTKPPASILLKMQKKEALVEHRV